jgi:hypothetical protein
VENETQTLPRPFKLRANRKVVEGRCGLCGKGFELAEDVYACPFCSGHHHAACWEVQQACPGFGGAAAPEAAGDEGASPSQPDAPPELASDERRCPACTEVIKRAAMKCRFCGKVLDQKFAAQISGENMPPDLAKEAESSANRALVMGLISFFICSPILAPQAISSGRNAHRLLNQYPAYAAETSAGGKARAGIVISWVGLVLFIIGFFSRFK